MRCLLWFCLSGLHSCSSLVGCYFLCGGIYSQDIIPLCCCKTSLKIVLNGAICCSLQQGTTLLCLNNGCWISREYNHLPRGVVAISAHLFDKCTRHAWARRTAGRSGHTFFHTPMSWIPTRLRWQGKSRPFTFPLVEHLCPRFSSTRSQSVSLWFPIIFVGVQNKQTEWVKFSSTSLIHVCRSKKGQLKSWIHPNRARGSECPCLRMENLWRNAIFL